MIEIEVLKIVGRKATVAFYYPVPVKHQRPGTTTAKYKSLPAEAIEMVAQGEWLEVIKEVKLNNIHDPALIKSQLNKLYQEEKDIVLNKHAKSVEGLSFQRTNGIWK